VLDPQAVSDYVIHQTRHFGISSKKNGNSCYFGRSSSMKVETTKDDDNDDEEMEDEAPTRKFVYTATTLRLME